MAKKSERLTERLFENLLEESGITAENGWKVEYQKSENPKLQFTAKTGTGKPGFPEMIITKQGVTNFAIIVEAKADSNKLIKLAYDRISKAKSSISPYAVNGAYHYAQNIANDYNVIFIGIAGDEKTFTHSMYFLKQGADDYVEVLNKSLFDINADFKNSVIEIAKLYNAQSVKEDPKANIKPKVTAKTEELKTDIEISDDDAKNLAADIHELLRDHGGVPANQKPVLIASVLLACDNPGFELDGNILKYTYKEGKGGHKIISSKDTATNTEGANKGEIILKAAIDKAAQTGMAPEKLAKLESSFKFIETHSALNADKNINGEIQSPLNVLCEIILGQSVYKLPQDKKTNLYELVKNNTINDILGHFYSEFLSYGASDGKGLGIVLTPSHITSLMVDLVGFNINSRLYDSCTGTGGFLVAGISKAFEQVKNDPSIQNKAEVLDNLRKNAFIGCEVEDFMFTIAATNMILRGDGKSNLFIDSCFNVEETVKTLNPTCSVLNPPYSLKGEGLKEIDFINHACNVTEKEGLVAAIVPKSIFLDKNKKERSRMLQNHSLVAVITMPTDLFAGTANTQTAIGLFKAHIPHDPKIKTWLCEFDDGFDLVPRQGRIDKRGFNKLKSELLERLLNKETIEGYSKLVSIGNEDECLYDCFLDTEKATPSDFRARFKTIIFNNLETVFNEYIESGIFSQNYFNQFNLTKKELDLNSVEWAEFVVEDLFEVEKGTRLTKTETLDGNLPYVSATSLNNGIDRFISNDVKIWNNAISVVTYGEPGISFYHPYTFGASDSVCVISLKNKELNSNLGVFICTSLEKLKPKYSYGKGLNVTRLKSEKIWLPIDSDGKPNYQFMEDYIKSLSFSEILD